MAQLKPLWLIAVLCRPRSDRADSNGLFGGKDSQRHVKLLIPMSNVCLNMNVTSSMPSLTQQKNQCVGQLQMFTAKTSTVKTMLQKNANLKSLLGVSSTTQPVKMSSVALDEICQNWGNSPTFTEFQLETLNLKQQVCITYWGSLSLSRRKILEESASSSVCVKSF